MALLLFTLIEFIDALRTLTSTSRTLNIHQLLDLQFYPQRVREKRINLVITRATNTLLILVEY